MPLTAYSKEVARELDLEQWLLLNQYSIQEDPLLRQMPEDLRIKAAHDIECSGCRAKGAVLVSSGRERGGGRKVSQGHFRFSTTNGSNPHHPFCDFYFDENSPRNADHLVNFASDKSALTRVVRDVVCRGIRAGIFSQSDIRNMRLWFLEEKAAHSVRISITPELLKWCIDMDATWLPDRLPFQPEHGQIPGFDWMLAAKSEWRRRHSDLFENRSRRVHFRKENIRNALKLIDHDEQATILNPTALHEKYQAITQLSEFAALYIYHHASRQPPTYWLVNGMKSAGRALLALCSLLLFISNWDASKAGTTFASLCGLPSADNGTEGNVMGLNPIQDYEAWQILYEAQQVANHRTDDRPVVEQINSVKLDLQTVYRTWLADAAQS